MHGLYVLFWFQEKHVPLAALATILAAGDLLITALEVPTGWFADRRGHRASLIIGSVAQIAGMLYAWLGEGIPGVLTSCVLIAIGPAFRSGADQALLYRSCVALGQETRFQTIEGRTRGLQLIALVGFVLAGGAIVERWGFKAGWLVEAALCTTGLIIACAMIDVPVDSPPVASLERLSAIAESRRETSILRFSTIVLPASILASVASAATFLAQTADVDAGRMTMLVAGVTLAEAAGAAVGAQIATTVRRQLILASGAAAIATAAFAVPTMFMPAVIALCFLMGIAYPMRAALIQREADDHVRARAASIASACDKATQTVTLLWAGIFSGPRRAR